MKYQIKNKNYNNEREEMVLYELLRDRGIQEPEKWLNPSELYEHSPLLLENMQKGIDILDSVIKTPEANILVVVDSDMDGYTSGAIIMNLLQRIVRNQDINYVLHPGKEHGIELKDIPENTDLIIVPDAGSSQKNEHLKLLNNGTKIIILDHHEIDNDFDYGNYNKDIAIISSQLNYPNEALSGAGVALKFAQYYLSSHGKNLPMTMYSLAACGIVADVMDIGNLENKQIITTGLKYLREHPFLYQLIKDARYNDDNPEPTIKDIGWVIGPNINAIIRLGTFEQKQIIFKALTSPSLLVQSSKRGEEGEETCAYLEAIRLCKNAKKRQTTAVNKSTNLILSQIDDNPHNSIVYIDENQELTFELSGLIANKILSENNKPVILLRKFTNGKDIDEYRGSVRGKPVEGLTNLKDALKDITGVEKAEGHAFAFGIGIDAQSINEFKFHLNSVLDKIDFNSDLYLVDLEAKYNNINKEILNIFARDDIWAHGVEKPLAVIQDVPTDKYEIMGADDQHIKIDCGAYDLLLFNAPSLAQDLLQNKKYNITAVGEFNIDKSYNIGRVQFVVKDYNLAPYTEKNVWDMIF